MNRYAVPEGLSDAEILTPYLEALYPCRVWSRDPDAPKFRSLEDWLKYVDEELRPEPWDGLHKHKKMQVKAADLILAYLDKLLSVGGDVTQAGPAPAQIPHSGTMTFLWLRGGRGKGSATSHNYDEITVVGPRIAVFPWIDGERVKFQPRGMNPSESDDRAIARNCRDLSGEIFAPVNILNEDGETKPCWNIAEMRFPATREDGMQLCRDYDGPLRYHPDMMRDADYKAAWLETHDPADYDHLPKHVVPGLTR